VFDVLWHTAAREYSRREGGMENLQAALQHVREEDRPGVERCLKTRLTWYQHEYKFTLPEEVRIQITAKKEHTLKQCAKELQLKVDPERVYMISLSVAHNGKTYMAVVNKEIWYAVFINGVWSIHYLCVHSRVMKWEGEYYELMEKPPGHRRRIA
jgi:hypothetical protein